MCARGLGWREAGDDAGQRAWLQCRTSVAGMPAPALDLQGILEEVVVAMMKEDEKKEWNARHEKWVSVSRQGR